MAGRFPEVRRPERIDYEVGGDHHLARLSVLASGGAPGPDSLCERPMDTLMEGGDAWPPDEGSGA